jgi:hypothetical protein
MATTTKTIDWASVVRQADSVDDYGRQKQPEKPATAYQFKKREFTDKVDKNKSYE